MNEFKLTAYPKLAKGDDDQSELDYSPDGRRKNKRVLKEQNQNIQYQEPEKPKFKQPKATTGNLFDRLNQEDAYFKQHNQELQEYYSSKQLEGCTFEPQLLNEQTDKRTLNQFLYDQQNYVQKVEQKLEQLKLQEEEKDLGHTYHPQTNNYSFQKRDETVPVYERLYALGKKPQTQGTVPTQESKSTDQYHPQIQEKSRALVRDGKVDDILYQDAIRRKQKQKTNQEQKTKTVSINMKFTSNNSEKIVAQKFIREFEATVDQLFDETGQDRPSNVSYSIDYLKLGEILQRMYFLNLLTTKQNERAVEYENLRLSEERALLCEIWSILRGDQLGGISKRNLCLFLLTLIGITDFKIKELPAVVNEQVDEGYGAYALAKDEEQFVKPTPPPARAQQHKIVNPHQAHDKPKIGTVDQEGNIVFSFEETKKIQKQFDILYRNRLTCEELKKSTWKDSNSYKPELNAQSKILANQFREKLLEETAALIDGEQIKVQIPENGQISHADLLILQKKAQEYKLEQNKKQWKEKELNSCTFQPQLISKNNSTLNPNQTEVAQKEKGQNKAMQLYSLAKPSINKRDRSKEEIEYEKQIEECTFAPDLVGTKQLNSSKQNTSQSVIAKDVDKTILRMREARKRREQINSMLERGYNSQPSPKEAPKSKQQLININDQLNTFPSQQFQSQEESKPEKQFQQESSSNDIPPSLGNNNGIKVYLLVQESERVPLLFVDVNLGPGKTERIVVYEGDQSGELAAKFAQEHGIVKFNKISQGLDDFMREKLKELLDYQISGLLTKIDEEMHSANSDADN